MDKTIGKLTFQAAALGAVAGMRSMLAPALFHRFAAQNKKEGIHSSAPTVFDSPHVGALLDVMALGELAVDKLPKTPSRLSPPSLVIRAASGALVGGALFAGGRKPSAAGAIVGGLAAVAASFAFYHLRQTLDKKTGLPDPAIALAEDALARGIGHLALR